MVNTHEYLDKILTLCKLIRMSDYTKFVWSDNGVVTVLAMEKVEPVFKKPYKSKFVKVTFLSSGSPYEKWEVGDLSNSNSFESFNEIKAFLEKENEQSH